jgi:hypothetical protein
MQHIRLHRRVRSWRHSHDGRWGGHRHPTCDDARRQHDRHAYRRRRLQRGRCVPGPRVDRVAAPSRARSAASLLGMYRRVPAGRGAAAQRPARRDTLDALRPAVVTISGDHGRAGCNLRPGRTDLDVSRRDGGNRPRACIDRTGLRSRRSDACRPRAWSISAAPVASRSTACCWHRTAGL